VKQTSEPEMTVKVRPFRSGGFEVDIRCRLPSGKDYRQRVKSPVTSKSGSMRWGLDRERHLLCYGVTTNNETPTAEPGNGLTMAEFSERYLADMRAKRRAGATLSKVESLLRLHVLPTWGSVLLSEFGAQHLRDLQASLAWMKPGSCNGVTDQVVAMLATAESWDLIGPPKLRYEPLKVPKGNPAWLPQPDLERLLEAAEGPALVLVLLGCDAGLRRGEILALEWSDVDFGSGLLTVARSDWRGVIGPTKGQRVRTVPLTPRLAKALKDHRHLIGARVLYRVPPKGKGKHVPHSADSLRRVFNATLKEAGLPKRGLHTLRHTFCSRLAQAGVPARSIQELAGHSSLKIVERYLHLAPDSLRVAISKLGDILETGAVSKTKRK